MKISLSWLGDSIEWKEYNPLAIADALTAHTAEVDGVQQQGALLEHCCVGLVLDIQKHPNADKLVLCDVRTERGTKRVVCGGTNLRTGMRVAFAHTGATVRWHGAEMMTLTKAKVRGEESDGMICAAEELDIAAQFPDATGSHIVDLGDGEDGVGTPLREYLGLQDAVLDIDNHAITNRPDLFSHIGFARECVAIGLAEWKKEPAFPLPKFPSNPLPFAIHNDTGGLIPRYLACTLSLEDTGETPLWMKQRLEATGWRSLNLPVDITNYVAMEVGMPMHSFDIGDMHGDIHMRTTKKGERVTTLDSVERTLPQGAVVLSDDEGIFDLLGIMGGLRSSTKTSSRNLLLHSAIVEPQAIRAAMLGTNLRTDAATVYEKGIPRIAAQWGFARALQLCMEHIPGARITSALEEWGTEGEPKAIALQTSQVQSLLGVEIPEKRCITIWEKLGCTVKKPKGKLAVLPPLWRAGDLRTSQDLIEEVGRIYGYKNIEPCMPKADMRMPARDSRMLRMRQALKESGGTELLQLSLIGPSLLKKCRMESETDIIIENPLGEELSILQPSTLPGMLEQAQCAIRQVPSRLRTWTIASVHRSGEEHMELCMLTTCRKATDIKHDPFLQVKTDLAYALKQAGHNIRIRSAKTVPPYAHPGRCADIVIDKECIGQICELHPAVRSAFDLQHRTAAATVNVTALLTMEPEVVVAQTLPQFPAVEYDETMQFSSKTPIEPLLKAAAQQSDLLADITVADLYGASDGEYSVTLRFTYRKNDRTLQEQEVRTEHAKVLAALAK